jgi:hypothetical protein
MSIGPALVLGILVGIFHTSLYVFLRGSADGRLPLLLAGACLGAWAGDAVGGRIGLDLLRLGDFRIVAASVAAWLGIGLIAVISVMGPGRERGR